MMYATPSGGSFSIQGFNHDNCDADARTFDAGRTDSGHRSYRHAGNISVSVRCGFQLWRQPDRVAAGCIDRRRDRNSQRHQLADD